MYRCSVLCTKAHASSQLPWQLQVVPLNLAQRGQEAQSPTQRVVAKAAYKKEEARQETTSNLKELDSDIICILICQTLCKRQEEKEETCICHHQPQSVVCGGICGPFLAEKPAYWEKYSLTCSTCSSILKLLPYKDWHQKIQICLVRQWSISVDINWGCGKYCHALSGYILNVALWLVRFGK